MKTHVCMQTKQALEMVVEAWETEGNFKEAVDACKEALAQPQPKLFLDLSNSNGNHPVQQEPDSLQRFAHGIVYETVKWINDNVGMVSDEAKKDLYLHLGLDIPKTEADIIAEVSKLIADETSADY